MTQLTRGTRGVVRTKVRFPHQLSHFGSNRYSRETMSQTNFRVEQQNGHAETEDIFAKIFIVDRQ